MALESDFTLLDQFVSGEEGAFDQLVVRHQKVVYYMVLRIVGNHDDAADITQHTFIKALTEVGKFKRRSSFRTWLCKIAINQSKNHLKKVGRNELVTLTEQERDNGDNPSDTLAKKEQDRWVRDAIRELPERQRLTLILRTYHNMAHREIAHILDITENNSRANYFHALKSLRPKLKENGCIDEL
jgi:RNA polymerase sigma-70 factor (ECF subfamily)